MARAGVTEIVMVGAVQRPTWRNLWPDWRTLKFFARLMGRAVGDNSLLSAVIAEVESAGFRVIGVHDVLTDLLAPMGVLGAHAPTPDDQADIEIGLTAALDLGRRDVGQAVVVQGGQVTDTEQRDGTDALIARARGGILVKTKKPQQERRVDLPTIGVQTVRNAAKSGLRGIAVEAGHTLIVDRANVMTAADAAGLFVVGLSSARARTHAMPVVYVVAAEPSGDQLGALLMKALRAETNNQVRIVGIGGPSMTEAGLSSLFDPAELALLGIFEVLPKAAMVLRRVRETVADIEARKPDVLVTIDSWGFTGRVHERLTKHHSTIPRVRYVAPQVWAWRPGRAKQLSRWINHLMTLFPFEPPYFTKYGLGATWVGHPVLECGADNGDAAAFRARHGIAESESVLVVLPGSRNSEIKQLIGSFGDSVTAICKQFPNVRVVVPTVPNVAARVRDAVKTWPGKPIVVDSATERFDAFAAAQAALAASGTVSLELAMAGVPHVIAYRANPLSAFVLRRLIRTKYVNLINVLLDRELIPERLQDDAVPTVLVADLRKLLNDEATRTRMKTGFGEALAKLSPDGLSPSHRAAQLVLELARRD
jgi:lipid-A-disaccharide synthase